MVIFKQGDIFTSTCSTLVNPVNCVGVMGKGLALEFKRRFPEMYADYVCRCRDKCLHPGEPYIYNNGDINIINFPTKTHWRLPSKLSYIDAGLNWFVDNYQQYNIASVAFPALGCGNGGLDWTVVKKLIQDKLENLPIEIEVWEVYNYEL